MKHWVILAIALTSLTLHAWAWRDGELLIWINGDKGYNGLEQVGAQFERELGIKVTVEHPESLTDKFFHAAKGGLGPDILMWAHDRLGEWADAGLLLPPRLAEGYLTNCFDKSWQAFKHRGALWGYPVAMETTSVLFNKALVAEPPTSLEEIAALQDQMRPLGCDAFMWDYNNTYFTWGILAGAGAYIFGQTPDGAYQPRDIGVNSVGAVAALDQVCGLINGGVIPRGVTYSVMEARMNAGKLAMMISGPWAWSNLRKSGIDFGVSVIPSIQGQVGRPFVGVLGAMLNRSSPNQDLAKEFIEHYLLTCEGLSAMDRDVPLGVPALRAYYDQLATDPLIRNSMRNVELGVIMPSIPQMGLFWSAMESALSTVTSGQATPREALDNAAKRMARGVDE